MVDSSIAANSMIKGKNTARIAAFIDGEQKSVPHNFALSTLNKGFTKFSEGDAYTGISKSEDELKQAATYFSLPPDGLGWRYGDCSYHLGDIEKIENEEIQEEIKYRLHNYPYLDPWRVEDTTTGYPIFYWQVKKP
jgi:hypothetical protein